MKETEPTRAGSVVHGVSLLTDHDLYLYREGTHAHIHRKLGAHPMEVEGTSGTLFSLWAPNAEKVAVIGDFNGWNPEAHHLSVRYDNSGIWEGFISGVGAGALYKFLITSQKGRFKAEKADPLAFACELRPRSASVVRDTRDYAWQDGHWMKRRGKANSMDSPISIYEVHLGSWMRNTEEGNSWLSYREVAPLLANHVRGMGFSHVEFLPLMEHPLDASWGYQVIGYFAPTSRFGSPEDFKFLVDSLHQHGIGVIMDWVPAHFPEDGHGLGLFDGTNLYEHADPRQGRHMDWGTLIFNYGRNEVRSFLLSNALFWLEEYHVDGLRVDAVASMIYLDYSRNEGEWIPNSYGGRENLEAIDFVRRFNKTIYGLHPDVITVAEESTAWPMVSRPTYLGGLGFGLKWNMGWMHDILRYCSKDPIYRSHHHNDLTFGLLYAFHENFVLPFSHDEVVHGKASMLSKIPGDHWQKFATLRCLYGFMYAHPGKKLLFMGAEIGQWKEWYHDEQLDWVLLEFPLHNGLKNWVSDLNRTYANSPALYEQDFEPQGFEWIDCNDNEGSTLSFIRRDGRRDHIMLAVCNFTPVPRHNFRVGVPEDGLWKEELNSDASIYGGSNQGNLGGLQAEKKEYHGRPWSLNMTLPPLGMVMLSWSRDKSGT